MTALKRHASEPARALDNPAEQSAGNDAPSAGQHFIPVRRAELVELLCGQPGLSAADRDSFRRLAERLATALHLEYFREAGALKAAYAPFDPDADTVSLFAAGGAERDTKLGDLFSRFGWLLERANFSPLPQEALAEALAGHSHWGLNLAVDFEVFDRLEIFVRGESKSQARRRHWSSFYRSSAVEIPAFERLVVILKLRANPRTRGGVDTDDVHVKLFKDIPRMDLEMLLPGTRVKMSLVDRAKILLPTLSGLGLTLWKVATGAVIVAASGMYNAFALFGLVGGSVGYGLRSFHGYLQTKQRYQLSLTESLYYQNLDNNSGVLMRLVDEAEEQENREALLGYYFLWRHAPAGGWSAAELDARIEQFLAEVLGRSVDFEVGDALDKLVRLRLAETLPSGRLCVSPPGDAIRALERGGADYSERRAA